MPDLIQQSARVWLAGQTMFEDSPMVEASRLVAALADRIDTLEAALRRIDERMVYPFGRSDFGRIRNIAREALGEGRDE